MEEEVCSPTDSRMEKHGMKITTVGLGAWAIGGEGWEHALGATG